MGEETRISISLQMAMGGFDHLPAKGKREKREEGGIS